MLFKKNRVKQTRQHTLHAQHIDLQAHPKIAHSWRICWQHTIGLQIRQI